MCESMDGNRGLSVPGLAENEERVSGRPLDRCALCRVEDDVRNRGRAGRCSRSWREDGPCVASCNALGRTGFGEHGFASHPKRSIKGSSPLRLQSVIIIGQEKYAGNVIVALVTFFGRIVALIFCALALLHLYWAAGGGWGAQDAVPHRE